MKEVNNRELLELIKEEVFGTTQVYTHWKTFDFSSFSNHLEDFGLLNKSDWKKFPVSTYTHEPEDILDLFIKDFDFLQKGVLIVEVDNTIHKVNASHLVEFVMETFPEISPHESAFMDGKTDYVFIHLKMKKALFLYCHEQYYAAVTWGKDKWNDKSQRALNNSKELPLPKAKNKENYDKAMIKNRYEKNEEHRIVKAQAEVVHLMLDQTKYAVNIANHLVNKALAEKFREYEANYSLSLLDAFEETDYPIYRFEISDNLQRKMMLELAIRGQKNANFNDVPHLSLYYQHQKAEKSKQKRSWYLLYKYILDKDYNGKEGDRDTDKKTAAPAKEQEGN